MALKLGITDSHFRYTPPGVGFREKNPEFVYEDLAVTWHWGAPGEIFITRVDREYYGQLRVLKRFRVSPGEEEAGEAQAERLSRRYARLTTLTRLHRALAKAARESVQR